MGGLEYDSEIFTGETIGRIAERLETLLAAVAADAERRVGELPILAGGGAGAGGGGVEPDGAGVRRETVRCTAIGERAGGADAGSGGGEGGRVQVELWRTGGAAEPAGALSEGARGRSGDAGGGLPGAVGGVDGGTAGDPEGGRGVRAAGP